MFTIIYKPTGTEVSSFLHRKDAEAALEVVETNPPSHEIIGEEENPVPNE